MADNHDQFIAFNSTIELTKTKKDTLKGNRTALENPV